MARPKKIGLEYFPLDCQMDDKIEMLEAEHDLTGFAVYIKLLQAIYQTEKGELDMSVVFRWKTLGKTFGIPSDNLRNMVDTMLEIGLFCKKCFEEQTVLTSNGIKKRLERVDELRSKDRKRKEPATSDTIPLENIGKSAQKEKEKEKEKKIKAKPLTKAEQYQITVSQELETLDNEERALWLNFKDWFDSMAFKTVTKIPDQMTPKQLLKLKESYSAGDIKEKLSHLENRTKIQYKSVYLTILNWLSKDVKV